MDFVKDVVRRAMADYAKPAMNGYSVLTQTDDYSTLTVVGVPDGGKPFVELLVRIVGDLVIVECDQNDHLLYEDLMFRGIPRSQIVLAYAGEKAPQPAQA